ncbi:MAG: 3-phosphoglycerate dehydrogenase [Clostridiales bacterium]|nr:MAG: 3-phosphoglycerate dehydrogenase [Clostridiales bacterium]
MYTIRKFNKIADIGLDLLDKNIFTALDECENPDGILVRSASLHEYEMNDSLRAIARAGAGTNNIPVDLCSDKGIVVFNTPGANANAVKELVLAGLLLSSRKISDAIDWAKTLKDSGDEVGKLVEKGKSQFAGPEISGKKLGIIGLGAIGILVANVAVRLGMEVYGYDAFLSVDNALRMSRSIHNVKDVKDIYANCDYITVHVPYNADTKGLINADALSQMKDGVRILNFARGELVDDSAIESALESGKVSCYVTDFPNQKTLNMKNVIAIPHLGASTPESEDNCAVMACKELSDYLISGNVRNSVNYPNVDCERSTGTRICVLHKNIPTMLGQITAVLSENNINIDHMLSKFKGQNAYAIIDLASTLENKELADKIEQIDGVVRVRIIK